MEEITQDLFVTFEIKDTASAKNNLFKTSINVFVDVGYLLVKRWGKLLEPKGSKYSALHGLIGMGNFNFGGLN